MNQDTKEKIHKKIINLTKELDSISRQIEAERNDSTEEDSSTKQELLDKKDIYESQIAELKSALSIEKQNSSTDLYGKVYNLEINGIKRKVTIVHPIQADPKNGDISLESPLAQALKKHKVGDIITVETPAGIQTYKII